MVPFYRVECAAKDREILWRWNKKARRKWGETTLRAKALGLLRIWIGKNEMEREENQRLPGPGGLAATTNLEEEEVVVHHLISYEGKDSQVCQYFH